MKDVTEQVRLIDLRTRGLVENALAGDWQSAMRGRGIDFDQVREYVPGDDVRAIDWNVTARAGRPFIKEFREERELRLMLLVDVSASGAFGSGDQHKRELAAELACVLAMSAARNNDRVGLILFSDRIEGFVPPGKGRQHVLRVVREILTCEPQGTGTDISAALQLAGGDVAVPAVQPRPAQHQHRLGRVVVGNRLRDRGARILQQGPAGRPQRLRAQVRGAGLGGGQDLAGCGHAPSSRGDPQDALE